MPPLWRSQRRKTAFDWRAYVSRCGGLKLLRQGKVHVDTLVSTQDGFSDTVHWQVIIALFPDLIEASEVIQGSSYGLIGNYSRQVMLPERIDGFMARKLLDCAYGERVLLDRTCLREFYLLSKDYNIQHAVQICLNHARSLLDILNCVQLLLLSLQHRHRSLRRSAYLMIRSNFKLLLHVNQDFHLLPSHYLKRLLLDDFLKLNEDEEFAWLAIVRWCQGQRLVMTLRELIELYNQMVAPPPPVAEPVETPWHPPTQPQINDGNRIASKEFFRFRGRNISRPQAVELSANASFYTQAVPFDWRPSTASATVDTSANSPLQVDNLVVLTHAEREKELFNLIKCLRFMRFRSVSAFNVILAHNLVKGNQRLEQLVNHMRLIYMIRKKIPVEKAQLELVMPADHLDKIKLSEMSGPRRALKLATRFVRHPPLSRRLTNIINAPPGRVSEQNPSKLKKDPNEEEEEEQTSSQLIKSDLEQLTDECLRGWADKPRVPNSVALLVGGWQDGVVSNSLVAYDFVCDKWFKLNIRMPEPRAFHASCAQPKTSQIFIFGGTNGESILNSVIRFDPSSDILTKSCAYKKAGGGRNHNCNTKQCYSNDQHKKVNKLSYRFHLLSPMRERRCHLSGVFHTDGKLYALGGHDGQQRLRSGEWYDTKLNRWHNIAEMTIARSDASACSHENKIFIAGGQISDQFIQSSVEFYKPNDNTWTFAAPMIVPRMSFRLVSYRNLLLAIGGTNGLMGGDEVGSVTRSVERYVPNQSSWSLCSPLAQKRSSFGVMNIEDNLIVAGGYGGRSRLKTCETLKIGHFHTTAANPNQPPVVNQSPMRLVAPFNAPAQTNNTSRQLTLNALGAARQPQLFSLPGQQAQHHQTIRSAMKWIKRADLPTKRSGFSIAVVGPLRNAREMTFHGSKRKFVQGPCVVKQRSRWHRLKLIKRRKLIRHLKIALVVTVVIVLM